MLGSGLSIYAFRRHEPCCLALIAGWLMGENMKDGSLCGGVRRTARGPEEGASELHAESCEVISVVPIFPAFPAFQAPFRLLALHPPFGCFPQVTGALLAQSSSLLLLPDHPDGHEPSRHTHTLVRTHTTDTASICHKARGAPIRFTRCPASSGDDFVDLCVPFRSYSLLLLPCAQWHYYDSFLHYIHRIICATSPITSFSSSLLPRSRTSLK